jgi:WD40 repeat protein
LASGGSDGTVRLWRVDDGAELAVLEGGDGEAVWSVGFGPDGGVVYAGEADGTLRRWPVAVHLG